MQEIYTDINIHASKERVWNVLTNFDDYPNWNPLVKKVKGPFEVDAYCTAILEFDGGKTISLKAKWCHILPQQKMSWVGSLPIPGLFKGEHIFEIEEVSANQVKFIHREEFSGLLIPLFIRFLGEKTKQSYVGMNEALKQIAEQIV